MVQKPRTEHKHLPTNDGTTSQNFESFSCLESSGSNTVKRRDCRRGRDFSDLANAYRSSPVNYAVNMFPRQGHPRRQQHNTGSRCHRLHMASEETQLKSTGNRATIGRLSIAVGLELRVGPEGHGCDRNAASFTDGRGAIDDATEEVHAPLTDKGIDHGAQLRQGCF